MPKPLQPDEGFIAVYDAWNRMVELAEDDSAGSGSGGGTLVAEYRFDGAGRRIVEQTYEDGTLDQTRHFYYSDAWQILEERVDGTGDTDLDIQYVWGQRYVDDLIARHDGSAWLFALQDANFRVLAIVNTSGSVVERYAYSPYGKRTALNPNWSEHNEPHEGSLNFRIGHQGLRHDETGLVYNRARMLHGTLGRFTSRDPLDQNVAGGGYQDGNNIYLHSKGRSLSLQDPSGKSPALLDILGGGEACRCGQEIEKHMRNLRDDIIAQWNNRSSDDKRIICDSLYSPRPRRGKEGGFGPTLLAAWDIHHLAFLKTRFNSEQCGTGDCKARSDKDPHYATVQVDGKCYRPAEVNYWLWGYANRLCLDAGIDEEVTVTDGHRPWDLGKAVVPPPVQRRIINRHSLENAVRTVEMYRRAWDFAERHDGTIGRVAWTRAGFSGSLSAPEAVIGHCSWCHEDHTGMLWAYIGHRRLPHIEAHGGRI